MRVDDVCLPDTRWSMLYGMTSPRVVYVLHSVGDSLCDECDCMFSQDLHMPRFAFYRITKSYLHLSQAMAFIGPMIFPHRPVATHCDICNVDLLCFPCYHCGVPYCGRCIFQHRSRGIFATLQEIDDGIESANWVAEGMHNMWHVMWHSPGSADRMASDPASSADRKAKCYSCRP